MKNIPTHVKHKQLQDHSQETTIQKSKRYLDHTKLPNVLRAHHKPSSDSKTRCSHSLCAVAQNILLQRY